MIIMQAAGSRKTSAPDFLICGNNDRRSSAGSPLCGIMPVRKEGDRMIRKKIDAILDKMSDTQLKRAYDFILYVYIYR